MTAAVLEHPAKNLITSKTTLTENLNRLVELGAAHACVVITYPDGRQEVIHDGASRDAMARLELAFSTKANTGDAPEPIPFKAAPETVGLETTQAAEESPEELPAELVAINELSDVVQKMDEVSQANMQRIVDLTKKLIDLAKAGRAASLRKPKGVRVLERIQTIAALSLNDLNYLAETVGCDYASEF